MISRQDLELKNPWWANKAFEVKEMQWPKRDLFPIIADNLDHPLILNIVGLRRVGKSTILKQITGQLLDQKVNPQDIFYFLFDYASQVHRTEFLDEVLRVYFNDIQKKPGLSLDKTAYVLLDEIQYIDNWQSVLKKYYDLSGKKIKFIVTGSQSVLLKGKFQESLAGRIFDYYLPPLSFREFLKINQEAVETAKRFDLFNLPDYFSDLSIYNTYHGREISELSREYIINGQFPEIRQLKSAANKQEYITESVIGKVLEDCIRIFNIEKADEFKLFTRQLLNNAGSIFELDNIGREIAVSRLTLGRYLEYLKESYVVEVFYKYHKSLIKRGRILKKLYATCVNFTCAFNRYTENQIDELPQVFGKIIENAAYNVLAQKYKQADFPNNLSFWRQGEKEIDFIIVKNNRRLPVEVKFSNNVKLEELLAITSYAKKNGLKYGIVVTKNELGQKNINGQLLYLIPYYLILLMD